MCQVESSEGWVHVEVNSTVLSMLRLGKRQEPGFPVGVENMGEDFSLGGALQNLIGGRLDSIHGESMGWLKQC